MSFSDWQGNEHLIARLKQMIRSGRIFTDVCLRAVRSRQSGWQTILSGRRSAKGRTATPAAYVLSAEKFDSGNSEDVIAVGAEGSVKDKDIELLISAAMKKSYTGRPVFWWYAARDA